MTDINLEYIKALEKKIETLEAYNERLHKELSEAQHKLANIKECKCPKTK